MLLLMKLYPEYNWKQWQMDIVPRGFWDVLENQRTYLDWLGTQLNVSHWEDWYDITREQVIERGGSTLLKKYGDSLIR
jgi:hypothetical protein